MNMIRNLLPYLWLNHVHADKVARRGGQNIVCQPERVNARKVKLPPWLGDDKLHQTHRSALLYKLSNHYEQYGWADEISDPKVDYLWPRPLVEGKEGEYKLCSAFWKKKGKKSPTTKTTTTKKRGNVPKKKSETTVKKKSSVGKSHGMGGRPRRSPRFDI